MGKSTISMAMFNSYVSSPEGNHHKIPLNPIKPQFSYGFPMVCCPHWGLSEAGGIQGFSIPSPDSPSAGTMHRAMTLFPL